MVQTPKSIGQELQNWLLRNEIDITHALFVPAVDLGFENAARDQFPVKRRATSEASAATLSGGDRAKVAAAI